ncbi:MAG TPA: sulfite exporter TauE/SafE family protein [Microthrixaceae bacterium]|nr:sulfite exporter TauE/SafE family protein [Microthrixaceae bacterium]
MDWYGVALAATAVGFCAGVLSALAGVGGAVLTTPGLRALGAPPLIAVGSTIPAIIPSAVTGAIRYSRAGLVDWRVAGWCGGAGMVSALAGAWTAGRVEPTWLMVLTALLVLWSSISVLRPRKPAAGEPSRLRSAGAAVAADLPETSIPSLVTLVAVGIGAGFIAGLLGVGGGIVLVPAFTALLRMGVKESVATSLVAVALMSITSLLGHLLAGHVDWAYALPLMVGAVPGARVGSRLTLRLPESTMRLVCGGLLATIGSVYLVSELIVAL